jgi:chromate transporter
MSEELAPPPSLREIFAGFFKIGVLGFGGVNALARRVIVEERRWMSERDYAELLGLGQVIPGPNIGNTTIMIGRRFGGLPGALSAAAGLYSAPLTIILLLATFYAEFGQEPLVISVIRGVALAAAGMILGNVLRSTERLRPAAWFYAIGALGILGAALLRLPLWSLVFALAPLSIGLASWHQRRRA